MRLYFFLILIFTGIFSVLLGYSVQASVNIADDVSYLNMKRILESSFAENSDCSKDKDIVVFLGATNAGKSTLINFLTGKELEVQKGGKIVLSNASKEDPSAMKIGTDGNSETSQPQSVKHDDLWFYDFPGFDDTRGVIASLFHAGFIKNIIENAATTRFVFVADEDELSTSKGKYIKNIIDIASHLAERVPVRKSSSLVITKSRKYTNAKELGEEIENMCGKHEILTEWINKGRLSRMSFAREQIPEEERPIILKSIIETSEPMKIKKLNTEILLKDIGLKKLRNIYNEANSEFQKSAKERANKFILSLPEINNHERNIVNISMSYYKQIFRDDPILNFLKNIYESDYNVTKEYYEYQYTLELAAIDKRERQKEQNDLINEIRSLSDKGIHKYLSSFLGKNST